VRIALSLKGLAYEYVAVNITEGDQGKPGFKALSPTGYVPCLVYDGVAYGESVAIIELLEERHPAPPLFPADAHARARVRSLVEIVNSGIQPLQNLSVLQYVSGDAAEQGRWLRHFVGRGLATLEAELEMNAREGVGGPYAFGSAVTAADVYVVPQVAVALRIGFDPERLARDFARVWAVHRAASLLPAFERASPSNQPDAPRD
jgi:maleylacetoacetate isomerase